MKNVDVKVSATQIVITMDRSVDLGPSGSGKSILVATTAGIKGLDGTDLQLGLNLFRKNADYKAPAKK